MSEQEQKIENNEAEVVEMQPNNVELQAEESQQETDSFRRSDCSSSGIGRKLSGNSQKRTRYFATYCAEIDNIRRRAEQDVEKSA